MFGAYFLTAAEGIDGVTVALCKPNSVGGTEVLGVAPREEVLAALGFGASVPATGVEPTDPPSEPVDGPGLTVAPPDDTGPTDPPSDPLTGPELTLDPAVG